MIRIAGVERRECSEGREAEDCWPPAGGFRGGGYLGAPPPFPQRLWPVVTEDRRRALQLALADGREALHGRTVWMLANCTPVGGGVAELLRTVTPYWLDAGIDAHWAVVGGGPGVLSDHQAHPQPTAEHPGDDGQLVSREQRVYERAPELARVWLERRLRVGDVVVLHDP